jgi:Putative zinc-finger
MNCRDVREVADSFLGEELLTETNHEILRHLETCPSCRTEIDARRRLRGALRTAFDRAPELQPAGEFADRLRDQLRQAAVHKPRSWMFSGRWLALAAGLVLAAGVTAAILLNRSAVRLEALAQDAIGDHQNCALQYRLVRTPVPLEEAAQRYDSAYRLLISAPPDDIPTPDGPARVIERHSCEYGAHRFGHVILRYRGRVVSLLVTANDRSTAAAGSATAIPHVIGRPMDGLSVVSVNGSHHAIMLVSDLDKTDLTQLAGIVSLPLVERVADVTPDRTQPTAGLFGRPVQELARYCDRRPDLTALFTAGLPTR